MALNNFLQFYGENQISPVDQNISNLQAHFGHRSSLYRGLGLPELAFTGKTVLEVAPGSGHNSIVTATWGQRVYDLVEPNCVGFRTMEGLLSDHPASIYKTLRLFNLPLEKFEGESSYDIVICEGLIPGLSNQERFLGLPVERVRPGGVLVLTCADSVSVFFESLRRYLGKLLTRDLFSENHRRDAFPHAADRLAHVFRSHLNSLFGMTRSPTDWVWDNLLNPAASSLASSNEFSIERCLSLLNDQFYFYGSRPVFLEDYRWYKELPKSSNAYNGIFLEQYLRKRHTLLHYQECGNQVDQQSDCSLHLLCKRFSARLECRDLNDWADLDIDDIQRDLDDVREIKTLAGRHGLFLSSDALDEFLKLFDNSVPSETDVSEMRLFSKAWGRGQQYISLLRA